MQEQQIKEKVKEKYGKIALTGNSDCCCCSGVSKEECASENIPSPMQSVKAIGYDAKDIESIHQNSILGVGCGAPTKFADIRLGETVVDLGSGAGIDVFLSANSVGESGKVIGIDITDEMLEKASKNAKDNGYNTTNVEFRKGDIEKRIPVEDNTADLVISNCVINLTTDKVNTFKEIYRVLKDTGGRMIISDLVTNKEVEDRNSVNPEKWCSCIDGALTKENYLQSISSAGFKNVNVLKERSYIEPDATDGRKIPSLVIKAVKD
jgi:arsenite methyltransferase